MTQSNYGNRAAAALDQLLPRPHRAKILARMLECSVRTAKHLLAGERWHHRRLTQASELLGDAFDVALSRPASNWTHQHETHDIKLRLARLEQDFEMARREATRMASDQSVPAHLEGREDQEKGPRDPK